MANGMRRRFRHWLAQQRLAKLAEERVEHQEALRYIERERGRQEHLEAKWRTR